jgi:hypothetical protein
MDELRKTNAIALVALAYVRMYKLNWKIATRDHVRLGAGRGDAPAHPGGQPGEAVPLLGPRASLHFLD